MILDNHSCCTRCCIRSGLWVWICVQWISRRLLTLVNSNDDNIMVIIYLFIAIVDSTKRYKSIWRYTQPVRSTESVSAPNRQTGRIVIAYCIQCTWHSDTQGPHRISVAGQKRVLLNVPFRLTRIMGKMAEICVSSQDSCTVRRTRGNREAVIKNGDVTG